MKDFFLDKMFSPIDIGSIIAFVLFLGWLVYSKIEKMNNSLEQTVSATEMKEYVDSQINHVDTKMRSELTLVRKEMEVIHQNVNSGFTLLTSKIDSLGEQMKAIIKIGVK